MQWKIFRKYVDGSQKVNHIPDMLKALWGKKPESETLYREHWLLLTVSNKVLQENNKLRDQIIV